MSIQGVHSGRGICGVFAVVSEGYLGGIWGVFGGICGVFGNGTRVPGEGREGLPGEIELISRAFVPTPPRQEGSADF